MATVAVIGGGIAGLTAAHYLSRLAPLSTTVKKIILLEASERFGGWIKTTRQENGSVFEHGPRTIRGSGKAAYNTFALLEDLDLDMELLPVTPKHSAANNRLIYHNHQLMRLPKSFPEFFTRMRPLPSSVMKIMVSEMLQRREVHDDESIYSFMLRRFGRDVTNHVVDPMVRGIFAGAIEDLSIKSCFPILNEYERTYGSVVMGMLRAPKEPMPECETAQIFRQNKWSMFSMEEGLEQIVRTLVQELSSEDRASIHTNTPCTNIEFTPEGKAKVYSGEELFEVDHVIGSCLSSALAPCLSAHHAELSDGLNAIPAVSVAVVNLEFSGALYRLQGFGHLIPSFEPTPVMGVIYDSQLFEEHNAKNDMTSRATVMMGGAWFEQHFGDPDHVDHDELGRIAAEELSSQLNTFESPITTMVHVHKNCIPQYLVGHAKNLQKMDRYINEHKLPLSLTGNSYRGVGVNDVILDSRNQVEKYLKDLRKGESFDLSNEVYL